MGETGVGKSCLLLKFVEGTFSDTFISTIGVDFKIKTVPMHDRKVKLQIVRGCVVFLLISSSGIPQARVVSYSTES